jgi:hypothetical protein
MVVRARPPEPILILPGPGDHVIPPPGPAVGLEPSLMSSSKYPVALERESCDRVDLIRETIKPFAQVGSTVGHAEHSAWPPVLSAPSTDVKPAALALLRSIHPSVAERWRRDRSRFEVVAGSSSRGLTSCASSFAQNAKC